MGQQPRIVLLDLSVHKRTARPAPMCWRSSARRRALPTRQWYPRAGAPFQRGSGTHLRRTHTSWPSSRKQPARRQSRRHRQEILESAIARRRASSTSLHPVTQRGPARRTAGQWRQSLLQLPRRRRLLWPHGRLRGLPSRCRPRQGLQGSLQRDPTGRRRGRSWARLQSPSGSDRHIGHTIRSAASPSLALALEAL